MVLQRTFAATFIIKFHEIILYKIILEKYLHIVFRYFFFAVVMFLKCCYALGSDSSHYNPNDAMLLAVIHL